MLSFRTHPAAARPDRPYDLPCEPGIVRPRGEYEFRKNNRRRSNFRCLDMIRRQEIYDPSYRSLILGLKLGHTLPPSCGSENQLTLIDAANDFLCHDAVVDTRHPASTSEQDANVLHTCQAMNAHETLRTLSPWHDIAGRIHTTWPFPFNLSVQCPD